MANILNVTDCNWGQATLPIRDGYLGIGRSPSREAYGLGRLLSSTPLQSRAVLSIRHIRHRAYRAKRILYGPQKVKGDIGILTNRNLLFDLKLETGNTNLRTLNNYNIFVEYTI